MSENITFLSDNAVSFSYTYSVNILNSEYFEDIEFAKTPNIDEMLDRNAEIRKGITAKFNTKKMPDMYALILLLLFLKIYSEECHQITTWEQFSNILRFNIVKYGVTYPTKDDELACLCGHYIEEVFVIEQGGYFTPLGSTCIQKSSIYNYNELNKILRVDCDFCLKNLPRPKPYDLTEDICKRCITKRNKRNVKYTYPIQIPTPIQIPIPIIPNNQPTTVVVSQKCIGCYMSIDTNPYKPKCKPCWWKTEGQKKYKPIPFGERRTV